MPTQCFAHIKETWWASCPSRGCNDFLTMINKLTRWLEVYPLKVTSTVSCVNSLLTCLINRFGVSALWTDLLTPLGIYSHAMNAYHPQSTGWTNPLPVKELPASQPDQCWLVFTPVMGPVRPQSRSYKVHCHLCHGSGLWCPREFLDVLDPLSSKFLQGMHYLVTNSTPPTTRHHTLNIAPSVSHPALYTLTFGFIRHNRHNLPLQPLYNEPYRVVCQEEKTFRVLIGWKRILSGLTVSNLWSSQFCDPCQTGPRK